MNASTENRSIAPCRRCCRPQCSLRYAIAVVVVALICTGAPVPVEAGSCREATLCCNGRDSSCVVQKTPINAIIEDLSDKPCYCDHACLKLGDCCADFKQHCGVSDCIVSDWGAWSDCDTACGTGMMSRARAVLQPPQNGGRHCPSIVQKRGCQGFKCHHHADRRVLRESALLLPAELSKTRHENDTVDIRKNLRLRYRDAYKHNREHEYCVEFEVVKAAKACHKIAPYNQLVEGERVIIRCDLEALMYDGKTSAGTASTTAAANREIVDNSSILSEEDEAAGSNNEVTEHTDKASKYRCRGEGLTGRNTRWSSLAVPGCRGKWLRLTVGQPKKCSKQSQFIFV